MDTSTIDNNETKFELAVRTILCETAAGDVLTYGEVATEAGYPGAARAVGNYLRTAEGVPWWRVVAANGRLHIHGTKQQRELLQNENVTVRNDKVVFTK